MFCVFVKCVLCGIVFLSVLFNGCLVLVKIDSGFVVAERFFVESYSSSDVLRKQRECDELRKKRTRKWFLTRYLLLVMFGSLAIALVNLGVEIVVAQFGVTEFFFTFYEFFLFNLCFGAVVCIPLCPVKAWYRSVTYKDAEFALRFERSLDAYCCANQEEREAILSFCSEPLRDGYCKPE